MDAKKIISEDMTIEEKLKAIDEALKQQQAVVDERSRRLGVAPAPVDPAALTICDGCE